MKRFLSFAPLFCLPVAAIAFASACASGPATDAPDLERGRYLVEQIGLCADCHSPRNDKGELVTERWLMGAPIPFNPTVPMPWAPLAPQIAGLPTLPDDESALRFLTTGELPGGRMLRPPMPTYRFAPDDARHVLAYLRNPAGFRPGHQPAGEAR